MKATRDAFGDQLVISAKDNENILALCADLTKATKLDKFEKLYPERFFDVGIAENNMIGIASGLSEHGYKVFLASFAAFLTGKYDTIRCSLAYSNCPVILVGSHSGMAIGRDGVTQMGLEDIGIMRALPNMTILNPATYNETKSIVKYLCDTELKNPHYLRLGRQPVEEVFPEDFKFECNKASTFKIGKDAVIFSTGCILPDVIKAVEDLDVSLIHISTLKPIDYSVIRHFLTNQKYVFTVEDHSIIGGLGTIMSEIVAEFTYNCKLTRIGLNDIFPESGKPEDLYEKYGLSVNRIKIRIKNELPNKI